MKSISTDALPQLATFINIIVSVSYVRDTVIKEDGL